MKWKTINFQEKVLKVKTKYKTKADIWLEYLSQAQLNAHAYVCYYMLLKDEEFVSSRQHQYSREHTIYCYVIGVKYLFLEQKNMKTQDWTGFPCTLPMQRFKYKMVKYSETLPVKLSKTVQYTCKCTFSQPIYIQHVGIIYLSKIRNTNTQLYDNKYIYNEDPSPYP